MSVCLSTQNSMDPTGWISVKFHILDCLLRYVAILQFFLNSDKSNTSHKTYEHLHDWSYMEPAFSARYELWHMKQVMV